MRQAEMNLENLTILPSRMILRRNADNFSTLFLGNDVRYKLNNFATDILKYLILKLSEDFKITLCEMSSELNQPINSVATFIEELEKLGILGFNFKPIMPPQGLGKRIRCVDNKSPISLEWLITGCCDSNCCYCIYDKYRMENGKELSTSEALSLVREIADSGVINVTLSGGEPLLRKDIVEIIRAFYEFGINIRLDTNGINLTKRLLDNLLSFQDTLKISISIDSLDPETNDKIRGFVGCTSRVIQNIAKIKDYGIYTNISTVLTKLNANIPTMIKLCNFLVDIKVEEWTIAFVRPFGKGWDNWESIGLFAEDVPELTFKLMDLSKEINRPRINFIANPASLEQLVQDNNFNFQFLRICEDCQGEGFLSVKPTGDIHTCLFLPNHLTKVGNVREASVIDLWNKAKRTFPLEHLSFSSMAEKCLSCPYLVFCKGGCRANALQTQGSLNECDILTRDRIEIAKLWLSNGRPEIKNLSNI